MLDENKSDTSHLWVVPAAVSFCIISLAVVLSVRPQLIIYFGRGQVDLNLYYGTISLAAAGLLVLSIVLKYESTSSGAKEMSVIGALSALSAASRLVIPVPNVKPCTFLIIAAGYVFGPEAGIMVGILTPAVSNMFLGQGYWTVWQMLMWAIAGWSGSILKRFYPKFTVEAFAAYAFSWGFLFGMPLDFATWLSLNANMSILPEIMLSGIPWNLLDGLGNLLFVLVAGRYTISILEKYRERFAVEYLD